MFEFFLLCLKVLHIILPKPLKLILLEKKEKKFAFTDEILSNLTPKEILVGAMSYGNLNLIKKYLKIENICDKALMALVFNFNERKKKSLDFILKFILKFDFYSSSIKKLYIYSCCCKNFYLMRFFANLVLNLPKCIDAEFNNECRIICFNDINILKFHSKLFGAIRFKFTFKDLKFLGKKNVEIISYFMENRCLDGKSKHLSYSTCYYENISVIEYLISINRFKLNQGLRGACFTGNLILSKMLIGLGANDADAAIEYAILSGSLDLFKYLLDFVILKKLDFYYVVASFKKNLIKEYIFSIHIINLHTAKMDCVNMGYQPYIEHVNFLIANN